MSPRLNALPSPDPSVLFRPVSEGAVLLHAEQEIYFGLNAVGTRVWESLNAGGGTLDGLVGQLGEVYPEVDEETLRNDVNELLEELRDAGLVRDPD